MTVTVDKNKYRNSILFFTKYCNNKYLGATKLNKLLYYLDFISYRDKGISVTGDFYIHKDYGPVPGNIDEILTNLNKEGDLNIELMDYGDRGTFQYTVKKDPDMSIFNKYENELLNNICKEFSLWPTEKIVNQTHLEAPWFYSKPYEIVDFNYAKDIEFFE